MAEVWKDKLNHETVGEFAQSIKSVYDAFPIPEFMKSTMDDWDSLELMARGRRITENMRKFLPSDYNEAISILNNVVGNCDPFFNLCFPTFVEIYGTERGTLEFEVKN